MCALNDFSQLLGRVLRCGSSLSYAFPFQVHPKASKQLDYSVPLDAGIGFNNRSILLDYYLIHQRIFFAGDGSEIFGSFYSLYLILVGDYFW